MEKKGKFIFKYPSKYFKGFFLSMYRKYKIRKEHVNKN